ncbi:hypothetical protein [Deinococcus sonorensis]|uniref:ATPase n=2 Tax=Deinococcus sonorensis TaxID=309891 RepID=A0AAU7UDT8_9DEIO
MARSELLLIGGRSGVGKTRLALTLHERLSAASVQHALIEGDTLDLAYPPPWAHGLAARNLEAIWHNYRQLGYRRLIYTNTLSVLHSAELSRAMGDRPVVRALLLTATDQTAEERLRGRETGASLALHLGRSARRAAELTAAPAWVQRLSTDGLTPDRLASQVLEWTGWLPG